MGYCFLTKDASGASLAVLVLKDRDPRAILAHPVLRKGRLHEDTVDQAVSSVDWDTATRPCPKRTMGRP
eukprot:14862917-Alexandrium_andersonii.AAC.1